LRSVRPNYTSEAMRAKVQGIVRLEGIVLPDGSVGDVRVLRSLDPVFGLDDEAIKAAKQFRFAPGTRFGQPVAVIVSFEIEFTLR
jgi:protein TonB